MTTPPLSVESTAATASLFAGYTPSPGTWDEMFSAPGQIRPHWQQLTRELEALGAADVKRRWEQAQRLIRENGVTYNAFGDAEVARPWHLDPVPLLVPQEEWHAMAESLAQRARLLDLVLTDLFGPQRLIREGVLPPELLFAHPSFYRSYHGLPAANGRYLQFYAADLARAPMGNWWVIGDRCRAPSGAGYALENRIATSRMFPGIFRRFRVERLASFFITLRETLQSLAPRFRDNPRIVLLSQGPSSPHYFEDAYLARYLGYTLVEGGDLAVRNNQMMLKTLGGLLPVEVILRRLPDDDCDPVELRGDSPRGVAGMVEVIRAGNVAVANSLGSRLVESPAFMAFLPTISRHLLGEELKLPSVATWWCGQQPALNYVLDHLDELLIRPAFRLGASPPVIPARLNSKEREQLIAKIKAKPADYVGQEQLVRSTAPVWTESGVQPWRVALRAFLVAHENSYAAMPGGLVRVSPTPDVLDWSMTAGERSQDLWVLTDQPIEEVSLLQPAGKPMQLRRSGAELPSRVADNLFWLGRNAERAEGAARLLRALFSRLSSEAEWGLLPEVPVLLRVLAEQGQIEPGFVVAGFSERLPQIDQALPEAVFNDTEPQSLRSTIGEVLRLASVVRDRISVDAWRIINQIEQRSARPRTRRGSLEAVDVLGILNHVVIDLSAFSGMVDESMTRTQGWRFLEIGRRIERAMHTSSLIVSSLVHRPEGEPSVLDAVLEVADSSMTYRSRYLANLQAAPVLDLLLTDESNPRSVGYQLAVLADHVDNLPRDRSQPIRGAEERIALSMLNNIRLVDVHELSQVNSEGTRKMLDRLLVRLLDQLPKLSEAIAHRYLIHAGIARQFAQYRPEGLS